MSFNKREKGFGAVVVVIIVALIVVAVGVWFYYAGNAKPVAKVYHIDIVNGIAWAFAGIAPAFQAEMTTLGYSTSSNIVYQEQDFFGDETSTDQAIDTYVAQKPDLLLVFPTEAALHAKAATQGTNIPVVFVGDVEGSNLINSIALPGANIDGVRTGSPEVSAERLALLSELDPKAKNFYIPYQIGYPISSGTLTFVNQEAAKLHVNTIEVGVSNTAELSADLVKREAAPTLGIDAIMVLPNALLDDPNFWPTLIAFANKHKLPVAGIQPDEAIPPNTGVLSLFPLNPELGQSAAVIADKILKGAQPGTIPIETGVSTLIVNYKTSQALGFTPDAGLLSKADQVIR